MHKYRQFFRNQLERYKNKFDYQEEISVEYFEDGYIKKMVGTISAIDADYLEISHKRIPRNLILSIEEEK